MPIESEQAVTREQTDLEGSLRFTGLSSEEASVRLARYGPNRLVRRAQGRAIAELLRTLADPMALMLAIAAGFYLWLGDAHDALVLGVALIPILGVDVVMEARSRRALKQLASAVAPQASVIRDGRKMEVASAAIVPGDTLIIREGDVAHADGIVRYAANLAVDESQLTGESEPQDKIAFNEAGGASLTEGSRLYAGSLVLAGQGFAEVTATGERTRFGAIARLVAEADTSATPLQRETSKLARYLAGVALALAACIFIVRIARGAPASEAFLYAISLGMSAVSEEFVLVFSLFLSLGAWRLGRIGVLVRRLASVETLGSTTVICLDKTGTLTSGNYELSQHVVLRNELSEDDLLEAAVLACERHPEDPIERAIIAHCSSHGVKLELLYSRWSLVHDYLFDPQGKHMSHVWLRNDDAHRREARIVAKGALEGVLQHCRLVGDERVRIEAAHAALAAQGMRILAVAGRFGASTGEERSINADKSLVSRGFSGRRAEDERDLELYGLLAFQDPLRREVPAAVAECQSAGIRLKLITGDHPLTAHAVAEAAGIIHRDDLIITGPELAQMSGERFERTAREASIFARVSPEQKYALVDALVRAGEVVAMTGDGVNDAPALRRAHVGVAMGRRGSEAARAAAALVLLDDNFGALVGTVREGRRVYSNIQRAFRYLVGFKLMLVGLALLAPLTGAPVLLLPVDLVWLELIVHPVSALAFEGDAGRVDLMQRPPGAPSASLISFGGALRPALSATVLTAGAFTLFMIRLPVGEEYARGLALAVVVVGSIGLVWGEFAGERPWWRTPFPRSWRLWGVCVGALATLGAAMWIPSIAALVRIAPISLGDWGLVASLAVVSVIWRAEGVRARPVQGPSSREPLAGSS